MKKFLSKAAVALMATTGIVFSASAVEVEVSGGADLVSSYVWRGVHQGGGAAVQPAMDVTVAGVSFSTWGSTPIGYAGEKELDFTIGYSIAGFSISATDYWWEGQGSAYFDSKSHQQEVSLGYDFGEKFEKVPLSLTWSTMVAGAPDKGADGKQQFSTYIDIAYPFTLATMDCTASLGLTPWAGAYAEKFDVASVALRFEKDFVKSEKFSMPIFVEVSMSPAQKDAYLVAGVSFAL